MNYLKSGLSEDIVTGKSIIEKLSYGRTDKREILDTKSI